MVSSALPDGGGAERDLLELPSAAELGFELRGDEERYARWLQITDRTILFPAHEGRPAAEHRFDVVGHPKAGFQYAIIFAFHPATGGDDDFTSSGADVTSISSDVPASSGPQSRTGGRERGNSAGADGGGGCREAEVTILREFQQGPGEMMFVLPSGAFDPRRHADPLAAAQAELCEEAHLSGGDWVDLMAEGAAAPPEVKWCRNRMRPWLCLGPRPAEVPGQREAEEHIEVHRVTLKELRRIIRSGAMMVPSIAACHLALDELQLRGLI
eukprot:CAMPEP_0206141878 /NCGR_PEP_ID=MMETSP1473-20131121/14512_1 /ASSEMBLY_ACC=CAM_ASM_001109 /TAXON_ID=1461547 /ORGANISM="Stichococcus sp, Strain RCC1054" /LENGTH=269 /DNA_ID=CAMNT_0053536617 /DNA_START=306 /DNA_END=1115 /DNA_ORIENTATION=+